jgi:hypothetical protein
MLGPQTSQGIKGVEALTLDYRVDWPISLLLSRRAITKYQLLSRLLYFSKHVESRVLGSWQDHQATRQLDVRAVMGATYCLRHRMLHFLQNFVYYMALEVVGPRAHEMTEALESAQDLDEVLLLHEKFLDSCLKECLLASQELLRNLTLIMTTCLLFADQMRKFANSGGISSSSAGGGGISSPPSSRQRAEARESEELYALGGGEHQRGGSGRVNAKPMTAAARKARNEAQSGFVQKEASHEAFKRMLAKFSDTFDSQIREFLERLWADSYRQHPQLANLCTRLDYNGFYTGRFSTADGTGVGEGVSGF